MPQDKNQSNPNNWNRTIVRLRIIAEPLRNSRNVLEIPSAETVFFIGHGDTNYLCGTCKCVLADSIEDGLLSNLVLKCNNCKSYNDILAVKITVKIS